MGGGSCQAVATRWRRVRDLRAIRWRRVARNLLTTGHSSASVPLGGVECATCVPFGDIEWHNQEALHRAGHQRQLRSNKHAFGDLVQPFKWAQGPPDSQDAVQVHSSVSCATPRSSTQRSDATLLRTWEKAQRACRRSPRGRGRSPRAVRPV